MTSSLKQQVERDAGDSFVAHYNSSHGTDFQFLEHSDAPDLVYRDGDTDLRIEITTAYYDQAHAKLLWTSMREESEAANGWSSCSSITMLLESGVQECLEEKCRKRYGQECTLVMYAHSPFPVPRSIESVLQRIRIPETNPFSAIYFTGRFATKAGGTYHCWKVT